MEEEKRSQESSKPINLFNLSLEQVKICLNERLDLNSLFLLEAFEEGVDMSKYLEDPKMEAWRQTLVRKSLINEQGKILNQGMLVLDLIRKQINRKEQKLTKNVSDEETSFDRWWKAYPGTDNFSINNKFFKGTRAFRVEKDACRLLYNHLINSGEYTESELLEALRIEVENRKEESYRTGENKMKYLKNSASYLRQYAFDAYVELVRKGFKSEQNKQSNQVDYSGGINI